MALTATANWLREFGRADLKPVWLVRIHLTTGSTEGTDIFSFVSGPSELLGYPNSVQEVAPVAAKLDITTREYSVGDRAVTFTDDGVLRDLAAANYLRRKKVTIKLGTADLQESDFLEESVLAITEVLPGDGDGTIQLRCADVGGLLREEQNFVHTAFNRYHPLQLIQQVLIQVGISNELYDATTLDPDNDTATSHFVVNRYPASNLESLSYHPVSKEIDMGSEPALDVVSDMCRLMNGSLVPAEDGRYEFIRYNPNAAAVGAWTKDEIVRVKQVGAYADLYNYIHFHMGPFNGDWLHSGGANDGDSITANAYPGTTGEVPLTHESEYLAGLGVVERFLDGSNNQLLVLPAAATDHKLLIRHAAANGFCGTLSPDFPANGAAAFSNGGLTGARVAYLLLDDFGTAPAPGLAREIVGAVSAAPSTFYPGVWSPEGSVEINLPFVSRYNITQRGLFGTTAQTWDSRTLAMLRVLDITIPTIIGREIVARTANGVPELEVHTLPSEYPKQVGDFVTVTFDEYIGPTKSGSDGSTVWEIVSKEPRIESGAPVVVWRVRWVRDDQAYVGTINDDHPVFPNVPIFEVQTDGIIDNDGNFVWIDLDEDGVMDTSVIKGGT